jgi:hypothetical protein
MWLRGRFVEIRTNIRNENIDRLPTILEIQVAVIF